MSVKIGIGDEVEGEDGGRGEGSTRGDRRIRGRWA